MMMADLESRAITPDQAVTLINAGLLRLSEEYLATQTRNGLVPKFSGDGDFILHVNNGVLEWVAATEPAGGTYWFVGTDVSKGEDGSVHVTTPVGGAKDGDLYLNTDTGDVFRFTSGEWSYVSTLTGGGQASMKVEVTVKNQGTGLENAFTTGDEIQLESNVINDGNVDIDDIEITTDLGEIQE